jgi:hypothetical protein
LKPIFSLKKEGIDFSSSNDPTVQKKRTGPTSSALAALPKDPNVVASQQVSCSF